MKRIVLSLAAAVALTGCGDVTWLPTPKPAPTITTSSLPTAPFGLTYNQTLTATGGTSPYTWALVSGTLPPGLKLNSNGTITTTQASPAAGNTANNGNYVFTVEVADNTTPPAVNTKSLTIFSPTTGRMYDTTHTVYAESLAQDTTANTVSANMGNQGTISHSVVAIVANYDNNGNEISGSSTTLTTANLAANSATTTPASAPMAATNTVNNWRIKLVSLQ